MSIAMQVQSSPGRFGAAAEVAGGWLQSGSSLRLDVLKVHFVFCLIYDFYFRKSSTFRLEYMNKK